MSDQHVLQHAGRTSDDRANVLSLGIKVAEPVVQTMLITATRGVGHQKAAVIVRGTSTGLAGGEITVRA